MDTCRQLYNQSATMGLMMLRSNFSSEAKHVENPTEAVKELHGKILDSVNVKRSMPPNDLLWSLIENCRNEDDISFLFDVLQNLRRFRLTNLRIHGNFNCNLCRQVAKACVRVGAINHALMIWTVSKRVLWKHNVHGLTPSVASAHHLLSYALEHKDAKLMDEVMKLVRANNLPLQPGTADLIFRICNDTDSWDLLAKHSRKFCKAGVRLRETTFDVWMEFAAKRGDTESLWNVDKLRSESYTQHTLSAAFSCAKGFLLEQKPEEAAAVIQIIYQEAYPDAKKSALETEFKKLVNEWPVDVSKHQTEGCSSFAETWHPCNGQCFGKLRV
uniref:Pentatricopeptide repeat-containing protein, mitochondrial n=1 Tax=Noccaea caerulescens TaxID=107243 RepID=A0A1J3DLC5_NOCCA